MTEQDLIDLGFEKQQETPKNGGYHYYSLGELLTNDNEEAEVKGWIVSLYGEVYDYHLDELIDVEDLIRILGKYQVESGFNVNDLNLQFPGGGPCVDGAGPDVVSLCLLSVRVNK